MSLDYIYFTCLHQTSDKNEDHDRYPQNQSMRVIKQIYVYTRPPKQKDFQLSGQLKVIDQQVKPKNTFLQLHETLFYNIRKASKTKGWKNKLKVDECNLKTSFLFSGGEEAFTSLCGQTCFYSWEHTLASASCIDFFSTRTSKGKLPFPSKKILYLRVCYAQLIIWLFQKTYRIS